jgi:hypothetical protein
MKASSRIISSVTVAAAISFTSGAWAQDAVDVQSPDNVSTLGEIVGAVPDEVSARLKTDVALVAMSEKALDARSSRKSTGKALAIVGFSIFGVGDIVGTVLIVTAPGYPNVTESGWGQVLGGLAVSVASMGVGLGLGIPGIVKMARPSDEERQLGDYYERTKPAGAGYGTPGVLVPSGPVAPPAQPPAAAPAVTPTANPGLPSEPQTSLVVPVLALTF